jgi:hypothetical protein
MTSPHIPRTTVHQPKQRVSRFFAKIGFDSLPAYAIAPLSAEWNLLSGTSSTFNLTPCSWTCYPRPVDFKLLCMRRFESTPRQCMLKHAALRHAAGVATPQKTRTPSAPRSCVVVADLIVPFSFRSTSMSTRQTIQTTRLICLTQPDLTDCNRAPSYPISAEHVLDTF